MTPLQQIAVFITPHGFGHAARACAVMNAWHRLEPRTKFLVFTMVPNWFFADSLEVEYTYHPFQTDIGLIQNTSLHEDIPETLNALQNFYPLREERLQPIAESLNQMEVKLILCDIAPIGLVLGNILGIPSCLIENFTWDWIYESYLSVCPQFQDFIEIHRFYNDLADLHIQAVPVCEPDPRSDRTVSPVSRSVKSNPKELRRDFHLPSQQKLILVTMGGVQKNYDLFGQFQTYPNLTFLLPGSMKEIKISGNVIQLPYHSNYYHPDLVRQADVVVGKTGYSTLAEVFHAGVPFGYINRENFREAEIMAAFIEMKMPGKEILQKDFFEGTWLKTLPELLSLKQTIRQHPNGADQIASFLFNELSS